MARKAQIVLALSAFFSAFFVVSVGSASAQTTKLPPEIKSLHVITGSDPAGSALKTLIEDKDKAKRLLAEALPFAKDPAKEQLGYNASLVLALVAADMKDLPACEAYFRNCIHQAAKLQSASKLLQSFGGLIEVYFENKKYDETTKLCQELINLKTDDGKERIVLFAYTNRRTGETEFYENDSFNTTEALLPIIFRQQVQAMAKQQKYDQAHKVVDNLIKSNGDWRDAQLKGWLYREAGQFDQAAKSYLELIETLQKDRKLSQKEKKLAIERNQYLLSNIYMELKDVDKSTEILQGLVKANPDDPGYSNDLGYIWADHDKNLDEAEKLIRHALEKDAERRKLDGDDDGKPNGAYLDSLGWVLFKKKDLKGAKKALVEALEDKNAQHIEIYDHLGDVLFALGERDGALKAWRTGLENVTESRRDQERKKMVEEKIKKNGN